MMHSIIDLIHDRNIHLNVDMFKLAIPHPIKTNKGMVNYNNTFAALVESDAKITVIKRSLEKHMLDNKRVLAMHFEQPETQSKRDIYLLEMLKNKNQAEASAR